MRPWQLWRHELGTPASADVLVLQEEDEQYNVSVGRSRDDAVICVVVGSSMTTEVLFLGADEPTSELTLLEPRRHGIEYGVEHFIDGLGRGWWLKITNEDATDFRLLARLVDDGVWRELIAERPGNRLDGVDAFRSFLAISERLDGCAPRASSRTSSSRPARCSCASSKRCSVTSKPIATSPADSGSVPATVQRFPSR